MDAATLLRRVPLLQDLSPDEIEKISRVVREETLPGNTEVLEIGAPGRALYIILEGAVRVLYPGRSDEFELARLGPGDFFGEMALLNDEPRSATVRTLSETRVLVVKRKDFREILLDFPTTAVNILQALSLRIRSADEQISALSDRAMRDTLTELLNRRAFHERLNQEAERHDRYGDEFALILVDIDHFRKLNDRFGHDVGDEVLRWMGGMLGTHTRAPDIPFRIGGEEFAILAPATGGEIAGIVAERLVRMVAEAQAPMDLEHPLTISAGFASCPHDGVDANRILDAADEALLRAKAAGRNRVGPPRPPD